MHQSVYYVCYAAVTGEEDYALGETRVGGWEEEVLGQLGNGLGRGGRVHEVVFVLVEVEEREERD